MSWMDVALFTRHAKAEPVLQLLIRAGFTPKIEEKSWLQALWFVPKRSAGFRLAVPADQFERTEKLLLDQDTDGGVLREAVRCPECKSLRVEFPQFARHSLMTNFLLGLAAELRLVERNFYCENCHYTWPPAGSRARRDPSHGAPYYFIEGIEQSSLHHPAPPSPPATDLPKAA